MNIESIMGTTQSKPGIFSFPAGITAYRYEPYTLQNTLEYQESIMCAEPAGSRF